MGLAHSKTENQCMTASKSDANETAVTFVAHTPQHKQSLDPRSPNIYRTPITNSDVISNCTHVNSIQITKQLNLTTDDSMLSRPPAHGLLKTILQRDLDKNAMLDPRSPTQFINRTPLNLKSTQSTTADESFDCSLVVENNAQSTRHTEQLDASTDQVPLMEDLLSACTLLDVNNKEFLETNFDTYETSNELAICDPRSPSLNVDRTPLVLKSEQPVVDVRELTAPVTSHLPNDSIFEDVAEPDNITLIEATPPMVAHKTITKHLIYEDVADIENVGTPKQNNKPASIVRTPLGCLGNVVGSQQNNARTAKHHSSLFIDEQQHNMVSTPKSQQRYANRLSNNVNSSKIPIFKSNALK